MRKNGLVAISAWVAKEVPIIYIKGSTVAAAKDIKKITLNTSKTLEAGESFRIIIRKPSC
jgi:hypothetical protein